MGREAAGEAVTPVRNRSVCGDVSLRFLADSTNATI
jgi:hypothetical protein